MGLMPAGSRNPFTKMDTRSVIGTLKATGSRDTDILHSQMNELMAPPNQLKLLGVFCMVIGAMFTVTVILAIAGIPFVIFGWWCWRFGKQNIAAIDAQGQPIPASAEAAQTPDHR